MSNSIKNIVVVLGLITVAFVGYYLYTQRASTVLLSGSISEQELLTTLQSTQAFISRSSQLEQIRNNTARYNTFFDDSRFRSLQAPNRAVTNFEAGKPDPFANVSPGSN